MPFQPAGSLAGFKPGKRLSYCMIDHAKKKICTCNAVKVSELPFLVNLMILQLALRTYFMEQGHTGISGHPIDNNFRQVYRLSRRTKRTTIWLPIQNHIANLRLISVENFACKQDHTL